MDATAPATAPGSCGDDHPNRYNALCLTGTGIVPGLFVQPPALSTVLPSTVTTNVAGGLTVVIEDGAIRVTAPVGADAVAFGDAILDRLVPRIEQALIQNEIQRNRAKGNVSVS